MQIEKLIYSVFSGTYYSVPVDDVKLLDVGQVPLKENPRKCKTCFNRGYIGRDQTTLAYDLCNCVRKVIDFDYIKTLLPNK
jgi:hypothetical protein